MTDKVFSDKLIEKCTVNFLPNKVLFAMGDSDEVKCASIWIKELEKEIERLHYFEIIHQNLKGTKHAQALLDIEYDTQKELKECQALLRRFLPKDESDWDQIIQLTQTEKDAMEYFRREK